MHDQIYGAEREEQLAAQLRSLAARIQELDRQGRLLSTIPELQRRLGDLRTQLFHYEVRRTYDTAELAESRRIVAQARARAEELMHDLRSDEDED